MLKCRSHLGWIGRQDLAGRWILYVLDYMVIQEDSETTTLEVVQHGVPCSVPYTVGADQLFVPGL